MAIMISIQPQWVEKILNGEKTIEIRKTMPKCELPQKVYIYCTNGKHILSYDIGKQRYALNINNGFLNRQVVAEFTLNNIDTFKVFDNGAVQYWNYHNLTKSCLEYEEIVEYIGNNKKGYAWNIDNLKIYDKPKELSEFRKQNCCYQSGSYEELGCWECCCTIQSLGECDGRYSKIKRPPQSWCYCEGLEEVNE